MKELLKQPQYSPMLVPEQVLTLFAGVRGYVDGVSVNKVLDYQNELLAFVKSSHPELLKDIAAAGGEGIGEDLEKKIIAVLEEFKPLFKESK